MGGLEEFWGGLLELQRDIVSADDRNQQNVNQEMRLRKEITRPACYEDQKTEFSQQGRASGEIWALVARAN